MRKKTLHQVLHELARQGTPDNFDLWPRLCSRLTSSRRRAWRTMIKLPLSLAGMTVIFVLMLWLVGGSVGSLSHTPTQSSAATTTLRAFRGGSQRLAYRPITRIGGLQIE